MSRREGPSGARSPLRRRILAALLALGFILLLFSGAGMLLLPAP